MSVIGYMRRSRNCKQIDLEKLSLKFKHADYVIDCGDLIVVVEETSRCKLDDLNKIDETIEQLYAHRKPRDNLGFVGIIHCSRRVDPQLVKILSTRMQSSRRRKRRVTYKTANCEDRLRHILSDYHIHVTSSSTIRTSLSFH